MPTSDMQRMHQDEWLSALRSGEFSQVSGCNKPEGVCALDVASLLFTGRRGWLDAHEHLGISIELAMAVLACNDGWIHLNPTPRVKWSFDEIADWFKAERDAHDGDLSEWTP